MSETIPDRLINPIFHETSIVSIIIANVDGTVIYEKSKESDDEAGDAGIISASISSIQSISQLLLTKLQKDTVESFFLAKRTSFIICQRLQEFFLIATVKRNPDTEPMKYLRLLKDKGLALVAEISSKGASEAITAKVKTLIPEAITIALVSSAGAPVSFLSVDQGGQVVDFDELASYTAGIGLATRPLGAQVGDSSISIGEKTQIISMNLPNDRILLVHLPKSKGTNSYLKILSENFSE